MDLKGIDLATTPKWFQKAVADAGAKALWVGFRHAPGALSRVDRVTTSGGVLLVHYAPESIQALDLVVCYRVGSDGKTVDVPGAKDAKPLPATLAARAGRGRQKVQPALPSAPELHARRDAKKSRA